MKNLFLNLINVNMEFLTEDQLSGIPKILKTYIAGLHDKT